MTHTFKNAYMSALATKPEERELRRAAIIKDLEVFPHEAEILEEASVELAKRIFTAVGEAIDSLPLTNGLRMVGLPYLLRTATSDLMNGHNQALAMIAMSLLEEEGVRITPGCDCPACKVGAAFNEALHATDELLPNGREPNTMAGRVN